MGQKLTSHLQDVIAAVPMKLAAATTALGGLGLAADSTTRAPLLQEGVLFHLWGHAVNFPGLIMLLTGATAALTLCKMVLTLLGGAARRIRRAGDDGREGAP